MRLAVTKRPHQFPRQMRVVTDELDCERPLIMVVQRPVDGSELSWRAIPQSFAETLDAGAVLAALEIRELLEHRRRFRGGIPTDIDRSVELWRQVVERFGN